MFRLPHRASFAAALVSAMLSCTGTSAADNTIATAVKATYLYKIAPFVQWPAFDVVKPTFRICVGGDDPFGSVLDNAVEDLTIADREVEVVRISVVSSDFDCQLLYIAGSAEQSVADMLSATRGLPILTITDNDRARAPRGAIHFIERDNTIRFLINLERAAENQIEISSKLLSLAVSVDGDRTHREERQ